MSDLRAMMDLYGITPKGQQDRRWQRPEAAPEVTTAQASPYANLKLVRLPGATG